ncbi:MAG: cytochrome P450 [Anaerolineae bacterium]
MVAQTAQVRTSLRGPKSRFFIGNLPEFNGDSIKFMLENRQYGDLTRFFFGPFPVLVINSPELSHEVLMDSLTKWSKPALTLAVLEPIIGNGLFTSEGDFWKRQRKLVQPAFHSKRIGEYGQVMADYSNDLAKEWAGAIGQERAIEKDMTHLTMRIIAKTLFDADVTVEASEVGETIREALALVEEGFRQLFPPPKWMPTKHNRRMKRAVARLDKLIQGFIDARRASNEDKGDFLSLLLQARDEDDNSQMTDKQVRDEAMTLFGAGHETTSVTMTWTWYLLSQHPEVAAKLHEELDLVLAGRLPTLADLHNLPYTDMVIKEAMRLYPAAWSVTRMPNEDVNLDGYLAKKGQIAFINVIGMHHDPRFFPQPEKFMPERFAPEHEKNIPKYAYLPFGGGPRVCIGNSFAMMEARLILATLAQRFAPEVAPGFEVYPDRQFTLKPKYGMKMVIRER